MAGPIGFAEVTIAIGQRWQAQGLDSVITGGIHAFEQPEGTNRPYAICDHVGDNPTLRTSKNRYMDCVFKIEVVADNLDVIKPMVKAVCNVFGEEALDALLTTENGAVNLELLDGPVTYIPEAQYVRAVMEFTARISQSRTR